MVAGASVRASDSVYAGATIAAHERVALARHRHASDVHVAAGPGTQGVCSRAVPAPQPLAPAEKAPCCLRAGW